MSRNTRRNKGLGIAAAVVVVGAALFAVPDRVSAQEGQYQVQTTAPQAVFESEKSWKFKDDRLVFFNPPQNPGGIRYIRWKDYTWAITQNQITVIDERPYGTQIQGQRGLLTEDGPQKDKDLMNDLKRQAGDVRKSREPREVYVDDGPAGLGLGLGLLGLGIGLGFSDYDHHDHHDRRGGGYGPRPGPRPAPHR